jgi:NhaP-type Na+/H+ and K+/H+ antiporter
MAATLANFSPAGNLLSPSELGASLFELKRRGLSLVDVRISPLSQHRGKLVQNLALPEGARLVCLLRAGVPLGSAQAVFLEEGDQLFIVTRDETAVRDFFLA